VSSVKLSELLEEVATTDVKVGGTTFSVSYRAFWMRQFSDEDWTRVRSLPGRDYVKEVLPRMLTSWEITDADGTPIPITPEAFDQHELPTELLGAIELAVVQGGLAGKASSNGLRAT
jgi:hypothetical protein